MNKWLIGLCAAAALTAAAPSVSAAAPQPAPIRIVAMGEQVATDTEPELTGGRVYVPIRAVSSALKATVDWDEDRQSVTVKKWAKSVTLTVGEKTAVASDGEVRELEAPVHKLNGRAMIPLRWISDFFGYAVEWQDRVVTIRSPLADELKETLYEGELGPARDLALRLRRHRDVPPLELHRASPSDSASDAASDVKTARTVAFPAGEALRFLELEQDVVRYIEIQDEFAFVRWEGYLDAPQDGGYDPFELYLQGKWKGDPPPIAPGAPLVYRTVSSGSDGSEVEYGRVDDKGTRTRLGYRREEAGRTTEEGLRQLQLPEEVRLD